MALENDTSVDFSSLRHRVTLQKNTSPTTRSTGQLAPGWTDAGTFWASIDPLSAREKIIALQMNNRASHQLVMRYQPGISITANDRFTFGSRVFNVDSVLNVDERNYKLVIGVSEIV